MHSLILRVPPVRLGNFPEEDKPYATVVWYQFSNLARAVANFEAALKLLDMAEASLEQLGADLPEIVNLRGPEGMKRRREYTERHAQAPPYGLWKGIAFRDGCFTLWHFLRALIAIKRSLDSSSVLRNHLPVRDVENGLKRLLEFAPDIKGLRDSVGHSSELMETPRSLKANATKPFSVGGISAGSPGGFAMENFSGRTFFTTVYTRANDEKGSTVSYELSQATLDVLASITDQIFSAYHAPSTDT